MDARPTDDPGTPGTTADPATTAHTATTDAGEGAGASKVTKRQARDDAHEGSLRRGAQIADQRAQEWTRPGGIPRMLVILLGLAAAWIGIRQNGTTQERGLQFATSDDGGRTWQPNGFIDREICECCWHRGG